MENKQTSVTKMDTMLGHYAEVNVVVTIGRIQVSEVRTYETMRAQTLVRFIKHGHM